MKMKAEAFIIVISVLTLANLLRAGDNKAVDGGGGGRKNFTIHYIGVFSGCQWTMDNTTNTTSRLRNFSIDSKLIQTIIGDIITDLNSTQDASDGKVLTLDYQIFDVCEDLSRLTDVILTIALDERFALVDERLGYAESTVLAVLSHLTPRFEQFLETSIRAVLPKTLFINLHVGRRADGTYFVANVLGYAQELLNFAELFGWHHITFLSITTEGDHFPYWILFKYSLELFSQQKTFCIDAYDLRSHDEIDRLFLLSRLTLGNNTRRNDNVFVLFGNNKHVITVLDHLVNLTKQRKIVVLAHDFNHPYTFDNVSLYPFILINSMNIQRFKYSQIEHSNILEEFSNNTQQKLKLLTKSLYYEIRNTMDLLKNQIELLSVLKNSHAQTESEADLLDMFYDIRKYLFNSMTSKSTYFNVHSIQPRSGATAEVVERFYIQTLNTPTISHMKSIGVKRTNCPGLICQPGHFKTYGNTSRFGSGWKCVLCPKHFFKNMYGNHKCIPCFGRLSIDNGYRTGCVDPYKNIYQVPSSSIELILIKVISCFGLALTTGSALIFWTRRKTPVVSTSDYVLSMVHQAVIAALFLVLPIPHLWRANTYSCLFKVLPISILYTASISVVFVKSQKLLKAFLSKVRISTKEVRQTTAFQLLAITLFLFSANGVLVVCLQHTKPGVFTKVLYFVRKHYCNTYFHANLVLGFVVFLQLLCLVQAFRGRNLPHVINDGMLLVYSTLVTSCSYAVMFVTVRFEVDPMKKDLYQTAIVAFNNLTVWFLLYGQKCFQMVFRPHTNTKEYFRKDRLREAFRTAESTMELRMLKNS